MQQASTESESLRFTEAGATRAKQLVAESGMNSGAVRIFVKSGGCSGYQYGMTIDEQSDEGDEVMVVADEDEAVRRANDTSFGLSAAVFTNDPHRAQRVARQLNAGGISINDACLTGMVQTAEKQSFGFSGLGGSRMGTASIRRFVRARALLANTGTASPWWFPAA